MDDLVKPRKVNLEIKKLGASLRGEGLLMLSYYYPPIKSMGVMRAYALSHQWLNYFEEVLILTTSNNARLQSEELPLDESLNIYDIPTFDFRTLTSIFSNNTHHSESGKASWIGRNVVKVLNSFPFNRWIGEGGKLYELKAFQRASDLIRKNNITHIYSSFRPHTDHIVAAKLKNAFPDLTWIADFRDIHVDVLKKNVFFEPYQHKQNRKILKSADVVTTVSEGCACHLRKYHDNVHVIYNGIDNENAEQNIKLQEAFTITYTGSLYGEMRNPSVVLEAIKELKSEDYFSTPVRIVYAGKDSATWKDWINKYRLEKESIIEGLCSYEKSRKLQRQSHINLQLTFAHPEVTGAMTGKIMEYVQAKRPILCVINGSVDKEIESFFSKVNMSLVVYNEEPYKVHIKNFIMKLYEGFLDDNLDVFEVEQEILSEISWQTIAQKFIGLFEKLDAKA